MTGEAIRSFASPETEFGLVRSDTPVDVDGFKIGEPKLLRCEDCGAEVLLTREPTPGIDELQHMPGCSQRFVKSQWWRQNVIQE